MLTSSSKTLTFLNFTSSIGKMKASGSDICCIGSNSSTIQIQVATSLFRDWKTIIEKDIESGVEALGLLFGKAKNDSFNTKIIFIPNQHNNQIIVFNVNQR